jgi:hypothetical protein
VLSTSTEDVIRRLAEERGVNPERLLSIYQQLAVARNNQYRMTEAAFQAEADRLAIENVRAVLGH